jgi:hypothetical protein
MASKMDLLLCEAVGRDHHALVRTARRHKFTCAGIMEPWCLK